MRNVIICIFSSILIIGCSQSKKDLYKETDAMVESLQTTYKSYGVLNTTEYAKTTSDGQYTVMPIGRLINVKIEKPVSVDEYESLRKDLEDHYHNDNRVNKVYISNAGTIMIDCRN